MIKMNKTNVRAHPRKGTGGVKRHSRNLSKKRKVPSRKSGGLIEEGTIFTDNAIIIRDRETNKFYSFEPSTKVKDIFKVTKDPYIWLDNTGIRPRLAYYGGELQLSDIHIKKRNKSLNTIMRKNVRKSYPTYLGTWEFDEELIYGR